VVAGLALGGCTNRLADVTYISTKAINQAQLASATTDNVRVKGEDIKEAIDNAIENKPCGIALKDAPLTSYSWYIPYLYGQNTLIAEGKVLEDIDCLAQLN